MSGTSIPMGCTACVECRAPTSHRGLEARAGRCLACADRAKAAAPRADAAPRPRDPVRLSAGNPWLKPYLRPEIVGAKRDKLAAAFEDALRLQGLTAPSRPGRVVVAWRCSRCGDEGESDGPAGALLPDRPGQLLCRPCVAHVAAVERDAEAERAAGTPATAAERRGPREITYDFPSAAARPGASHVRTPRAPASGRAVAEPSAEPAPEPEPESAPDLGADELAALDGADLEAAIPSEPEAEPADPEPADMGLITTANTGEPLQRPATAVVACPSTHDDMEDDPVTTTTAPAPPAPPKKQPGPGKHPPKLTCATCGGRTGPVGFVAHGRRCPPCAGVVQRPKLNTSATCGTCGKTFESARARAAHERYCRARVEASGIPASEARGSWVSGDDAPPQPLLTVEPEATSPAVTADLAAVDAEMARLRAEVVVGDHNARKVCVCGAPGTSYLTPRWWCAACFARERPVGQPVDPPPTPRPTAPATSPGVASIVAACVSPRPRSESPLEVLADHLSLASSRVRAVARATPYAPRALQAACVQARGFARAIWMLANQDEGEESWESVQREVDADRAKKSHP